jgi:hypothetical protein
MSDADWQQGTRSQGLGDRKAGVSRELDALAAYVQSLQQFAPSPFRQPDGTLTDRARDGAALFQSKGCTDCHGGADYTASARLPLLDIGTLRAPTSGQRMGATLTGIDVQTLRDAWSTAPYLHDGSARTLEAAIRAHRNLEASDLEVRALARFVAEIGDVEAMPDTSAQVAVPRVREALVQATVSGVYVVRLSGGSPARLWIGGQLILDGIQPDRAAPGRVRLSAGERYLVRLEQPAEGSSWPRVLWRRPGDTRLTEMPLSAP